MLFSDSGLEWSRSALMHITARRDNRCFIATGSIGVSLQSLTQEDLCGGTISSLNDSRNWALSLSYFLTFGALLRWPCTCPFFNGNVQVDSARYGSANGRICCSGCTHAASGRNSSGQGWWARHSEVGVSGDGLGGHIPSLPDDEYVYDWGGQSGKAIAVALPLWIVFRWGAKASPHLSC